MHAHVLSLYMCWAWGSIRLKASGGVSGLGLRVHVTRVDAGGGLRHLEGQEEFSAA